MPSPRFNVRDLGVGVGLRAQHRDELFASEPAVGWFECISENYMVEGGPSLRLLDWVRERYPVVLHGTSLGIGNPGPLDRGYLARLKALCRRVRPRWVTDHLCWTSLDGRASHDLLPLPMVGEVVRLVAARAREVQDMLEVPFALENVSSYLRFAVDELSEPEFLTMVADEAGCGVLLDINNIHVSAYNHGFSAEAYVDAIRPEQVLQLHLAGFDDRGTHLLDTHANPVCDEVWALFRRACRRLGRRSVLIEWDDRIPPLPRLLDEAARAEREMGEAIGEG